MCYGLDEAFARWQTARITQLGFVNNLLIGLAAGMMTLEASAALGKLDGVGATTKSWLLYSIALLVLSVALGICLAFNRLYDIRYTTQIVRVKQKLSKDAKLTGEETRKNGDRDELSRLRHEVKILGSRTWCLLWGQTIPFFAGTLALLYAVYLQLK
jgi:hypothetical protein